VRRDHRGDVAALLTDDGEISGDFFIDATGFRRLLMGESLQTPWTSYAPYLLLDSALPFLMPSRAAHPPLVTHSKALDAGWMWTIPTQGRLGCGYVFSSAHAGEQDALRELEAHWGGPVEPINRFRFEAGRLERCWSGNVMAVGLASGFVEPLEATSIGQTLSQLASFGDLVADTQGHVTQQSIDHFCHQTAAYWDGIRDFLVMHYDTPRADTAFWRDVRAAPRPASYLELKSAFGARTPRDIDFAQHAAGGRTMFGALSWMAIAAPMKLLKPDATLVELARLDKEKRERLLQFVEACLPGREAT
jgi:tryptophan halogenase